MDIRILKYSFFSIAEFGINNSAFDDWNGKTLTINTSKLQISEKEIQDIFKSVEETKGEDKQPIESLLEMMEIDFKNQLLFDNKTIC